MPLAGAGAGGGAATVWGAARTAGASANANAAARQRKAQGTKRLPSMVGSWEDRRIPIRKCPRTGSRTHGPRVPPRRPDPGLERPPGLRDRLGQRLLSSAPPVATSAPADLETGGIHDRIPWDP